MNDGLLDIAFIRVSQMRASNLYALIRDCIVRQGMQVYDHLWEYVRGDRVVVENVEGQPAQEIQIDGECLMFEKKIEIEVVPKAFQLVVDYD